MRFLLLLIACLALIGCESAIEPEPCAPVQPVTGREIAAAVNGTAFPPCIP
jgi:hypothetical protein